MKVVDNCCTRGAGFCRVKTGTLSPKTMQECLIIILLLHSMVWLIIYLHVQVYGKYFQQGNLH